MSTGDDQPSAASPVPAALPKKPSPGMPWGQAETFHLIDAYEEKWLELKRSQLKTPEWEEVAATVAERSGTGGACQIPSKSGTQCRHKIEKLRKRFKSERARPVRSFWPFFDRMARLDRGPTPISVFPPMRHVATSARSSEEDDDDEVAVSNSRSVNGLLHYGVPKEVEVEEEKGQVGRGGNSSGDGGLAGMMEVVKGFGEEVSRIEKRKMEILREIEKDRMEMEMKRQKMVMEAQQYLMERIIDAISGSTKKSKKLRNSFQ
jgi:Myb/SANT-like DNA-binding domain